MASALFKFLGRKAPGRKIDPLPEARAERMLYAGTMRSHIQEWTREVLKIVDRYFATIAEVGIQGGQLQQHGTFTVRRDGVNSRLQTAIDLITLTWEDIEKRKNYPKLLDKIGGQQNNKVGKYMRTVVGIQPRTSPRVGVQLDAFRERNLNLITSLQHDTIAKLKGLLEAAESGARVETIRDQIVQLGGVSESRADLIARDQTLKLNGQLNQVHQQNAGLEEYDWDTSGDERVREGHAELDGTRQRWDSPPDTGNGEHNHPGDDIQCRCAAIPVIPEFEPGAD